MLKGWVLTDRPCPRGCNVPLMRSPSGTTPVVQFCANCDGGPSSVSSRSTRPYVDRTSPSSPSIAPSTHYSRASTPPTEVSSALSSPTFAPPLDTAESLRRRQQSDAASAEIGKRLLKGWAMLADECPNPGCYGIPLVRPPKPDGGKDPRKECVACGTVYVDERDASGWERLVPLEASSASHQGPSSNSTPSGESSGEPLKPQDKGKSVAHDEIPDVPRLSLPPIDGENAHSRMPSPEVRPYETAAKASTAADGYSSLQAPVGALEKALLALCERLVRLSSLPDMLDPASIAQTADAISRVIQALTQVKQLQAATSGLPSHS